VKVTGNDENDPGMKSVALTVGPRYRDLAGFRINRVWPTARRRLIGPFIFYDHMLSTELPPGHGLDVPPHPHIGLATVTYLFAGELVHRDSLGTQQLIRPGDLNWMIAGNGITHSERTSDADRRRHTVLHGTQAWVALPRKDEQCDPDFMHVPAADIPERQLDGVRLRMLAGSGFGMTSPLPTSSPLHYAQAHCSGGSALDLGIELGQRAAFVVAGELRCNGATLQPGRLFVFADATAIRLEAQCDSHVMLLGGTALSEDRHVWWNFVASSAAQIDAAKQRWAADDFPPVPGDSERMPMPAS
jgi:redox-sensitive bicupin YhaK (pirin superfamily)